MSNHKTCLILLVSVCCHIIIVSDNSEDGKNKQWSLTGIRCIRLGMLMLYPWISCNSALLSFLKNLTVQVYRACKEIEWSGWWDLNPRPQQQLSYAAATFPKLQLWKENI